MQPRTALITGVLGQDGSYLSRLLLDKGYRVAGLIRPPADFYNHEYLGIAGRVDYRECDLSDEPAVAGVVAALRPDEVYHLGGLSSPGKSWAAPKAYTETNAFGSLYLLEAIRKHAPQARVFNAATSEMFGMGHEQGLQTENTPFLPTNPYAVTKTYAYWMADVYRKSYGLFIANGILFSHESPLRQLDFVTRKISHGVAAIKLGLAENLRLGNLDSRRDWGFAGDYVRAMWMMLQHSVADNFVISTGTVHSIRDFLHAAFGRVGIADWERYIEIDKALYRPVDLDNLYGQSSKAMTVLGWKPTVGFDELVGMMVDADLKRLSAKAAPRAVKSSDKAAKGAVDEA